MNRQSRSYRKPSVSMQWDTARARSVEHGLRRMTQCGLLSEMDRRTLAARVEALPTAESRSGRRTAQQDVSRAA